MEYRIKVDGGCYSVEIYRDGKPVMEYFGLSSIDEAFVMIRNCENAFFVF